MNEYYERYFINLLSRFNFHKIKIKKKRIKNYYFKILK